MGVCARVCAGGPTNITTKRASLCGYLSAKFVRAMHDWADAYAYDLAFVCTTNPAFPNGPVLAQNDGQEKLCGRFSRSRHAHRIEANLRLSYMTAGGI